MQVHIISPETTVVTVLTKHLAIKEKFINSNQSEYLCSQIRVYFILQDSKQEVMKVVSLVKIADIFPSVTTVDVLKFQTKLNNFSSCCLKL